jgi:hypothetical protein
MSFFNFTNGNTSQLYKIIIFNVQFIRFYLIAKGRLL